MRIDAMLRSALLWVWMGLSVMPWTAAVALRAALGGPRAGWRAAVQWFTWVTAALRTLVGAQLQVHGLSHLPSQGAAVLLVKHQSTLETLWLPTVVPHPLAFVFKRELLRIPFFGWSMACLDMVHIDRESRAAAMKQVIEQGSRLLAQGTWVVLFPEGTRMARGQTGTYQTAGARLALQAGVPVVPVAVATARVWPKQGWGFTRASAVLSFGPALHADGRDARALMRAAQTWIEAEMRRIDPEAYPTSSPSAATPAPAAAPQPVALAPAGPAAQPNRPPQPPEPAPQRRAPGA